MKKRINVAVLGCGPAGLLAAEGALAAVNGNSGKAKYGVAVQIWSLINKSRIHGAQYLHEEIPGITNYGVRKEEILYYKMGTAEGYATKVYDDPRAPVSWNHFEQGLHPGWEMEGAYDSLWLRWEKYINALNVTLRSPSLLSWAVMNDIDVLISTIPKPTVCRNPEHTFPSRDIWITDKAWDQCPDNCIVYNGDIDFDEGTSPGGWYRTSKVFGHESTEFGHYVENAVKGIKVLTSNCDCVEQMNDGGLMNMPLIACAGRWGRWERGVLAHHAYRDGMNAVQQWIEQAVENAVL